MSNTIKIKSLKALKEAISKVADAVFQKRLESGVYAKMVSTLLGDNSIVEDFKNINNKDELIKYLEKTINYFEETSSKNIVDSKEDIGEKDKFKDESEKKSEEKNDVGFSAKELKIFDSLKKIIEATDAEKVKAKAEQGFFSNMFLTIAKNESLSKEIDSFKTKEDLLNFINKSLANKGLQKAETKSEHKIETKKESIEESDEGSNEEKNEEQKEKNKLEEEKKVEKKEIKKEENEKIKNLEDSKEKHENKNKDEQEDKLEEEIKEKEMLNVEPNKEESRHEIEKEENKEEIPEKKQEIKTEIKKEQGDESELEIKKSIPEINNVKSKNDEEERKQEPIIEEKREEPKPNVEEKELINKPDHNFFKDVPKNQYFILENGEVIRNTQELKEKLLLMPDKIFYAHVTDHKNDFATWIHHCVKDDDLASKIGHVKNKDEIIKLIDKRISELKSIEPVKESEQIPIIQAQDLKSKQMQEKAPEIKTETILEKIKPEPKQELNQIPEPEVEHESKPEEQVSTKTSYSKETIALKLLNKPVKEILKEINLLSENDEFYAVEEEIEEIGIKKNLLKTGVPGFDDMIGEGIPEGSSILVSGGPGSGKTTFCIQMLGEAAERGEKCLFMTFEETEQRLIEHMESYGLRPKKYLEEGTLVIQKQDPFKVSRMMEALLAHGRGELMIDINEILEIIPQDFNPDRVVIDSLSAIAATFSESSTAYRIYISQLVELLNKTGATSFLISEIQGMEKTGHGSVEEFITDGVIIFYNLQKGNLKQSALEILKMRAVNHLKKIVPFEFVEGKGILVYPLEKVFI